MSAPAWSRPLADVLGAPLHAIDATRVAAWVNERLAESEQLDLKAKLYGRSDSDRRELAGDLAAFANHRGGVLILGVDENEQGAAAGVPGVAIDDDEVSRIHSVVAGNVMPYLPVDVQPIPTGDDPAVGVMLVTVGPSPLRPHAVAVNNALRYPRRNGTVTRYLTESEVADLYRNRFEDRATSTQRVVSNREEAIRELDVDDALWVAVSAVPAGPGSLTIDAQGIAQTADWAQRFRGFEYCADFLQDAIPVVRPGPRRLRLTSHYNANARPNYLYAELHADGSAVACRRVGTADDARADAPEVQVVPNTTLLWTTAAALNVVVSHAVRTGAWGDVNVELTVFGRQRELGFVQMNFVQPIEGGRSLAGETTSAHTILLDEVAASVQALLAATRILLTDIFHAFGSAEVLLLTPSGALRMGFLGHDVELKRWADAHGVATE